MGGLKYIEKDEEAVKFPTSSYLLKDCGEG